MGGEVNGKRSRELRMMTYREVLSPYPQVFEVYSRWKVLFHSWFSKSETHWAITCYMPDFNLSKNLLFPLNMEWATKLAQGVALHIPLANRLVFRLKKYIYMLECSTYGRLMTTPKPTNISDKVPSVRAENTYPKNDSVNRSESGTWFWLLAALEALIRTRSLRSRRGWQTEGAAKCWPPESWTPPPTCLPARGDPAGSLCRFLSNLSPRSSPLTNEVLKWDVYLAAPFMLFVFLPVSFSLTFLSFLPPISAFTSAMLSIWTFL